MLTSVIYDEAQVAPASLFKWYWLVEILRCTDVCKCWKYEYDGVILARRSLLHAKDTVSPTIGFPTFSSQRPFQCSGHSLSIFEFTRMEYPINGYVVIHELKHRE